MKKNYGKIVDSFWKKCYMLFLPYRPPLRWILDKNTMLLWLFNLLIIESIHYFYIKCQNSKNCPMQQFKTQGEGSCYKTREFWCSFFKKMRQTLTFYSTRGLFKSHTEILPTGGKVGGKRLDNICFDSLIFFWIGSLYLYTILSFSILTHTAYLLYICFGSILNTWVRTG